MLLSVRFLQDNCRHYVSVMINLMMVIIVWTPPKEAGPAFKCDNENGFCGTKNTVSRRRTQDNPMSRRAKARRPFLYRETSFAAHFPFRSLSIIRP